jgi:hypothetical protein
VAKTAISPKRLSTRRRPALEMTSCFRVECRPARFGSTEQNFGLLRAERKLRRGWRRDGAGGSHRKDLPAVFPRRRVARQRQRQRGPGLGDRKTSRERAPRRSLGEERAAGIAGLYRIAPSLGDGGRATGFLACSATIFGVARVPSRVERLNRLPATDQARKHRTGRLAAHPLSASASSPRRRAISSFANSVGL